MHTAVISKKSALNNCKSVQMCRSDKLYWIHRRIASQDDACI